MSSGEAMHPFGRDHNQLLHELLDSLSDHAVYMLDLDGRVASWNTGAERLMGYSATEIDRQSYERFFRPEDRRTGVPGAILARAARDGRAEVEGWRLRKDGTLFWGAGAVHAMRDDAQRLTGFAKITRDMTAEREAQQALQDSERRFRLLVDGVIDYAIYMLDLSGTITNWNQGAERIKGYAADEVIGRHFSIFYTPEDREDGLPARALATALRDARYEAEGWRMRRDGTRFWASVIIDPIRDEHGELIGFAKITRDATERRNAQLELQRAQERLTQAQKMEALGRLTGGVAHDFNNLLMVVSGQAQLLRNRLADDPRVVRALDAIEASARRGADLTRHLLTFARRQRLQPGSIPLADRTGSLRELLAASLPSGIVLEFEFPADLWTIEADVSEFELALLNLAVNARDAMTAGGVLTIRADNVVLADGEVDAGLSGEFIALSVGDTGAGIAPDILPRIFEPFFTTKDVNTGTGLGLSQVFGFAQQSGGRVLVTSELGAGTTFTLYLPRGGEPDDVDADTADYDRTSARPARVLLVEDNPEVAEVAAHMLEQLGHRVNVANGAAAALNLIETRGPPDLVFSDIVMAGELDGVALARRLRELHPATPVLLATGYSEAAEKLGGEFAILRKPYKLVDLGQAIAILLSSHDEAAGKLINLASARRARRPGSEI